MSTILPVFIGQRLRELRTERLLSQAELGRIAGIHRDQVSRIERDAVEPHFSTIRKLASALDIEPRELVRK